MIRVRFNADTNPALPWKFAPEVNSIDLRIGESQRFPEPIDVEQDDRLAVQSQLRPGGDLSELIQRARASDDPEVRQLAAEGRL